MSMMCSFLGLIIQPHRTGVHKLSLLRNVARSLCSVTSGNIYIILLYKILYNHREVELHPLQYK